MNFTCRRRYSLGFSGNRSAGSVFWNVAWARSSRWSSVDDPERALLDAAATQAGELLEDPVEREAREEDLGRVVQGHVVLRADVLAPAEEVRDGGLSVLVEPRGATGGRRRRRAA